MVPAQPSHAALPRHGWYVGGVIKCFKLVERLQKRMVVLLAAVLKPRPEIQKELIGLRLAPAARRLGSKHELVDPHIPYCLPCGWGLKGVTHGGLLPIAWAPLFRVYCPVASALWCKAKSN